MTIKTAQRELHGCVGEISGHSEIRTGYLWQFWVAARSGAILVDQTQKSASTGGTR
jgi:hypothetical protein